MKSLELAEMCGIHAGDGYLRNDGKRIELDISGSLEEKIYYDNHVIPLFSRTFGIQIKGKFFNSRNTYGFVIRNEAVVNKMHKIGFPYGKKSLIVKIPEFILQSNNQNIKKSFLRGLLDTDGCITFDRRYTNNYNQDKRTFHYYPRLTLSTVSENLSVNLESILKDLNLTHWTQKYNSKKVNENKKTIFWFVGKNFEKWMELIGSKNPIKHSRFEIWKKYGFCPPNTKYEQRINILNNKLNPKSLYGPVAQSDRALDLSAN